MANWILSLSDEFREPYSWPSYLFSVKEQILRDFLEKLFECPRFYAVVVRATL